MKLLATILVSFATATVAHAAPPVQPVSDSIKKQVMAQLMASPAVRGAYAESKKWSGAKKCTGLQIEEISADEFKVYASCTNPEATGQFHVTGQILSGMKADSPVLIVIKGIEFTNAG